MSNRFDYSGAIATPDDGYVALARAVCASAVHDYVNGRTPAARAEAREFILSSRFCLYSGGMDGEDVLRLLDEGIASGRLKQVRRTHRKRRK